MYLELTAEQAALQQTLREYFAAVVTPAEADEMLVTRHGPTYREVVRRMGRDGWLGVGWPTEYGGHGFGQKLHVFPEDLAVAAYWLAAELPKALQSCHHLHGGLGVDITYPLHRYYAQAKDLARLVGGAGYRLDRLAER